MRFALYGLAALLAEYCIEQPALGRRALLDRALVQMDGAHLRRFEMPAGKRLRHSAVIAHAMDFARGLAHFAGQLLVQPVPLAQRVQPGGRLQPDFARGEFKQRVLEQTLNVPVGHLLNAQEPHRHVVLFLKRLPERAGGGVHGRFAVERHHERLAQRL